ncbi:MAG: hypothetical protein GX121_07735 [Ignavibacteria bacterium]|jgi:hypothetical protein|nr:hypothetical protein [Ignavibacteria bacterium]
MIKTKDEIIFSRSTWDELYQIDYFREVLENLEDREAIKKSKKSAEGFISFREYDKKRKQKANV